MKRLKFGRQGGRWRGHSVMGVLTPVVLAVGMITGGCAVDGDAESAAGCSPPEESLRTAWSAVLGTKCLACHNADGLAKHSKLVLAPSSQTGYEAQNLAVLREVSTYQVAGQSVLLMKPTARVSHGGGPIVAVDSLEYQAIARLVQSLDTACSSAPAAPPSDFFDGVELLDPARTFRRAAIVLGGRVPSPEELAALEDQGEAALAGLVDGLMSEPAFYEHLQDVWNDKLLTNKYDRNEDAVNLLPDETFPHRRWWKDDTYTASEAERALGEKYANRAVAREPLELLSFVVREGRPFTEIVTADYILTNPMSARVYGVESQVAFDHPDDPTEWRPAKLPGIPHAGMLTSPMLLNRFPTTATNRNRARARLVWNLFLATDVMRVAERPIDPTGIQDHNPTLFSASCSVCHALLDPIAGTFAAWDDRARFEMPEEGWYADMRPPGFGDERVPYGDESKGLAWLGQRIATDPRFATAAVRLAYTLLTGQGIIELPTDEEALTLGPAEFAARGRASEAQARDLEAVAKTFVDEKYDFKAAVRALVMSPWFRVRDAHAGLDDTRLLELAAVGPGRLLTPEELDRKITSVVGYPWEGWGHSHPLVRDDGYRLFYGGIDSDTVLRRITSPSGLMASVQDRLSNEVACQATARDFARLPEDRLLFPLVERTYEPEDVNGFDVPEADAAIHENLRWLVQRFWGEKLANGDPELEALYDLWLDVWRAGRAAVLTDAEDENLRWDCQARDNPVTGEALPDAQRVDHDQNYTVRAWMVVLSALTGDYQFLYE